MLATVKGYMGHQESAAGAVGLVEAMQVINRSCMAPALHIRHLNPHVYGALRGQKVLIARSGPVSTASEQVDGSTWIGVSSFGAQGTNAHAILRGSSSVEIVIDAKLEEKSPWKLQRMWVAPFVKRNLDLAWVRRRTRNHSGSVTFESKINLAKNVDFSSNQIYGRPHLLPSGLLATMLSAIEMTISDPSFEDASLLGSTFPAPLQLPKPSSRLNKVEITISSMIKPVQGQAEVYYQHQKVLGSKVALSSGAKEQLAPNRSLANFLPGIMPSTYITTICQIGEASRANRCTASCIEAVVTTAGNFLGTLPSPPTWVRSVEAISANFVNKTKPSYISSHLLEEDGWAIGTSAILGGEDLAMSLNGIVVGEHDLPPTSPGPLSAQTPHADIEASVDEFEEGLAADHPLLLMSDDERVMHIQSQVRFSHYDVNGYKPDHTINYMAFSDQIIFL